MSKEETAKAQELFLQAFADTANVRASCVVAGIDRVTVWSWDKQDDAFAALYGEAKEDANDAIRQEIWSRAMVGIEKPVVSMGKVVLQDGKPLTVREPSDRLLEFMARSRMPEYRDKQQIDLDVKANVHNTSSLREQLRALPTEHLDQIEQWLLSAKEDA